MYKNFSHLKGFRRFFTSGSCRLLLKAEHLDSGLH